LKEKALEAEAKVLAGKLKGYERNGKYEDLPTKLAYEAQYHAQQERSRAEAAAKLD